MGRVPVRLAVAGLLIALVTPCASWGQGGGRGGPPGGGITGLLQTGEVQQELDLMDDQRQELSALAEEMRSEIGGMFEGMRGLSPEERRARFGEIRAKADELRTKAEGRVQEVLLPHQFERLKQIELQSQLQRGGASALSEGELADTLGLTDAQREQLRARSEEVQQELQEKIYQLRVEARNKLMEVLTPEQKAKLQTMIGEDFKVPDQPRGGRFFGRGGRRGPGGAAAGGGQAPATTDSPSGN